MTSNLTAARLQSLQKGLPPDRPTDEELAGAFRSARERFLGAAEGSLDHDLYPMFRAATQIRDTRLTEALLTGAAREVDALLNREWGAGRGGALMPSWEVWLKQAEGLTRTLRRCKSEINRWDPLDPADGGPVLATAMLHAQIWQRLQAPELLPSAGHLFRACYHKAEWVPGHVMKGYKGVLLANFILWGGYDQASTGDAGVCKNYQWALKKYQGDGWKGGGWNLVKAGPDGPLLGVAWRLGPSWANHFKEWGRPTDGYLIWDLNKMRVCARTSRSGFNPPGWDRAGALQDALRAMPEADLGFQPPVCYDWLGGATFVRSRERG